MKESKRFNTRPTSIILKEIKELEESSKNLKGIEKIKVDHKISVLQKELLNTPRQM